MHPDEMVREVQEKIQTRDGILVKLQQLAFDALSLDDVHQLSSYCTIVTGLPPVFQLRVHACSAMQEKTEFVDWDIIVQLKCQPGTGFPPPLLSVLLILLGFAHESDELTVYLSTPAAPIPSHAVDR